MTSSPASIRTSQLDFLSSHETSTRSACICVLRSATSNAIVLQPVSRGNDLPAGQSSQFSLHLLQSKYIRRTDEGNDFGAGSNPGRLSCRLWREQQPEATVQYLLQ